MWGKNIKWKSKLWITQSGQHVQHKTGKVAEAHFLPGHESKGLRLHAEPVGGVHRLGRNYRVGESQATRGCLWWRAITQSRVYDAGGLQGLRTKQIKDLRVRVIQKTMWQMKQDPEELIWAFFSRLVGTADLCGLTMLQHCLLPQNQLQRSCRIAGIASMQISEPGCF